MQEAIEAICRSYSEVLGVPAVGPDDDFFMLGGHSLRAMVLSWRIRRALGVEARIEDILAHPSPKGLAATLRDRAKVADAPGIEAAGVEKVELSPSQRGLWFLQKLDVAGTAYNVPLLVRLRGPLQAKRFLQAIELIGRRHDMLRTRIAGEQDPPTLELSEPSASAPSARSVELSSAPANEREAELERFCRAEAARPFDLDHGPLWRAFLVRMGENDHAAFFVFHHLICDDWSLDLMLRELGAAYRGELKEEAAPSGLGYLRRRAARALNDRRAAEEAGRWWRARWTPPPPPAELLADREARRESMTPGARVEFRIPPDLHRGLAELARRERLTRFATCAAAFYVLLRRYTGERDLVIGTPTSQRDDPDAEGVFAYLVNTLPLRLAAGESDSFRQVMRMTHGVILESFAHSSVPFPELVEMLHPIRSPGRMPLVTAMFQLDSTGAGELELPGVRAEIVPVETGEAKFDLYCSIIETADGAIGFFEYARDLFDPAAIERMVGSYLTLLRSIVENPDIPVDRLRVVDDSEATRLLDRLAGLTAPYPSDRPVHALFSDRARDTPDSPAVVDGAQVTTYASLEAAANRVAHRLIRLGVRSNDFVAIGVGRSVEYVVGVLGILKAGAAYMPLDLSYPPSRLSFMLRDTRARVLVVGSGQTPDMPSQEIVRLDLADADFLALPAGDPGVRVNAIDPAYVIYTSGSTGEPKGVVVPHRAISRLVLAQDYAAFGPDATHLLLAPTTFDASTFELWGALLHGAKVAIYGGDLVDPAQLRSVIEGAGVTRAWLTAALYNAMIDSCPEVLAKLAELLIGGEALSVPHVRRGLDLLPGTRIINGYGPTESTTFACTYPIPRTFDPGRSSVPIGRPLHNTQVYILDRFLQPVPMGAVGELCIGGDGLALGYLNNPELTQSRFVEVRLAGRAPVRVYRSGDLARHLADGSIEFRGRMDNQVKIRGFRIEPDEIAAALNGLESVRQAVVLPRRDAAGEMELVAYVAGPGGGRPDVARVRAELAGLLPKYMLPAHVIAVDSIPMNRNGKVDRAALPDLAAPAATRTSEAQPSASALETRLLDIWRRVLAVDHIDRDDNFFDLGGHSLLAVKLFAAIERELGQRLPMAMLFRCPTARQLGAELEKRGSANDSCLVSLRDGVTDRPIFVLGGIGGQVFAMKPLVDLLAPERACFGLEPPGLAPGQAPLETVEEIAGVLIRRVKSVQPKGPWSLVGYSFGGVVAFEMAKQLRDAGGQVADLMLIDSYLASAFHPKPLPDRLAVHLRRLAGAPRKQLRLIAGSLRRRLPLVRTRPGNPSRHGKGQEGADGLEQAAERVASACMRAYARYEPRGSCDVHGHMFMRTLLPDWQEFLTGPGERAWIEYMRRGVTFHVIPGDHFTMIEGENAANLADVMNTCFRDRSAGSA